MNESKRRSFRCTRYTWRAAHDGDTCWNAKPNGIFLSSKLKYILENVRSKVSETTCSKKKLCQFYGILSSRKERQKVFNFPPRLSAETSKHFIHDRPYELLRWAVIILYFFISSLLGVFSPILSRIVCCKWLSKVLNTARFWSSTQLARRWRWRYVVVRFVGGPQQRFEAISLSGEWDTLRDDPQSTKAPIVVLCGDDKSLQTTRRRRGKNTHKMRDDRQRLDMIWRLKIIDSSSLIPVVCEVVSLEHWRSFFFGIMMPEICEAYDLFI